MFQEKVGFSLCPSLSLSRFHGTVKPTAVETNVWRVGATLHTIPAVCARVRVPRRSGPGREGGTLWKMVRTTRCTKHVDS